MRDKEGNANPLSIVSCAEGHKSTLDNMVKAEAGIYICKEHAYQKPVMPVHNLARTPQQGKIRRFVGELL